MPSLRPVAAVRIGSNQAASRQTLVVSDVHEVETPPMMPPMLPSGVGAEDSPMFFHPPMIQHQDETDALFAAYLHPPMLPPDDSPPMSSLQLHPPMLPGEWKMHGHSEYDSNAMVTF